jgi:hypothetical protein
VKKTPKENVIDAIEVVTVTQCVDVLVLPLNAGFFFVTAK